MHETITTLTMRRGPLRAWVGLALWMLVAVVRAATPVLEARVNDDAHVLGDSAMTIEEELAQHEQRTGQQVVVLTVPDLGGQTIEAYANDVFAQWKLGHKGVDDGVLIVVAMKEHRMRIEVGYGLEGQLTDLASARIIRERMEPRLATGDVSGGVESGVTGVLEVLDGDAPVVAPVSNETPAQVVARLGFWRSGAGFFVALAVLFCGLFTWMASQGGSWWSLFLLGPLTLFLLLLVWSWPVVAAAYVAYLVLALVMRRRRMRAEYLRASNRTVTAWPPSVAQLVGWSGPRHGGLVGEPSRGRRRGSDGSYSSSSSSSGYSGGGGSSGGGGASGSW